LAFEDHRISPDLPNVRPPMSAGEDLEIDVPLRIGSAFIPVQTRTAVVEKALDEGDYGAFRRRWRSMKNKRQRTDRMYATKLLNDPVARKFLRREGITHVLPVVCGPYPDPVVAPRRGYWLRSPADEDPQEVFRGRPRATPRILTPEELGEFLGDTDEDELRAISAVNGWLL